MDIPYVIGGNYLLRTVTHIVTGKIESVGPLEIVVSSAAWIADTGRYANAIATGSFNGVEVGVGVNCFLMITPYRFCVA